MKKIPKLKNPSTSKKSELDVAGFMVKIQEQLSFLADKIDSALGQNPAKPSEAPFSHQSRRQADRAKFIANPSQPPRSGETKQAQGRGRGRPNPRRERILHKAVCAECKKDCEIPFKPSGERPVYCKECFSKRKGNGSPSVSHNSRQVSNPDVSAQPPQEQEMPVRPSPDPKRRVTVTKRGVGKVVVTEVAAPSERDAFSQRRNNRPPSRPKR